MTRRQPQPSSPAAIADDVQAPTTKIDPDAVPPLPGPAGVMSLLVLGMIVAAGALVITASLLMIRYTALPRPHEYVGPVLSSLFACLGMAVFVRRWWRSLKSREKDPARWLGLSVPFFVVAGTVVGFTLTNAARPVGDRGALGFRDSILCEELTGYAGGPVFDKCVAIAAECQDEAIAAKRRWGDYAACASARWPPR